MNFAYDTFSLYPTVYRIWDIEDDEFDFFIGYCVGDEAAAYFYRLGYAVERA